MKKEGILTLCTSILALALVGAALAQGGQGVMGSGGMSGRMGGRMYDPKAVTTVRGEVVAVNIISGPRGRYQGLHLNLKTASETVAVHLGPSWYFDQQKVSFAPKDNVEITGSLVTFEGKPAIIAAEVKKGGQTLKLRDANGIPVWAGQGRRQRGNSD